MRLPLLALAAALVLPAAAMSADAPSPHRKAGWWEITSVMFVGTPIAQVMHLCTDAATEAKTNVFVNRQGSPPGVTCAERLEKTDAGWDFGVSCQDAGGRSMITEGTATGDFDVAYKLQMTNRMNPPPNAVFASTQMAVDAKWISACPAGRIGGDMLLPTGQVVSLNGPAAPPR